MEAFTNLFSGLFWVFYTDAAKQTYYYLGVTSPVWLPLLLSYGFWNVWIAYLRIAFIASTKHILLELHLPPEVHKSPLAMELVLTGLFITGGEGTWWDRYIHGKMRAWFTFEIVSKDGIIHFYLWTREGLRNVIEAQFYGQYPNIELVEVEDYTRDYPKMDLNKYTFWGIEYVLEKPDPYPIKTYVDYGLDKDPDEEYKVDPLTSVIEYLATLKKGEQIWIQVGFRAHKMKKEHGAFFGSGKYNWVKESDDLVEQLRKEWHLIPDGDKPARKATPGQMATIEAIERSSGKLGFDVGIRAVYMAPPNIYNGARTSALRNIFRQFNTNDLNGFKPTFGADFDYPWEDFFDIRKNYRRKLHHEAYRRRSFFNPPYKRPTFVLNQEELATIIHLPGGVLQTAAATRVASKKAAPPTNLPQ